ncbi:alpha-L-fucosidase [Carboxylicivirga sediminis]|uniref:alpha-L-fucosidase n=1 Tax=Carboxylicivirga sediminis TaxID=2006564 RepID=A0A941F1T7_9BACT|nr:alpha-L-fucosidase [Carboxylicivirga sediminis]MBR8534205.1 alpha-L-fucosidase [Carboxylicivirga sediminis]
MKKILLFVTLSVYCVLASSQAVYEDERYVPETDPLVLEKIQEWQDLKFGLLMHWGAYSQWGIVESWSLCPEEYGWCERTKGANPDDYFAYKQEYEDLIKTFNPTKFDPDKWADAAEKAGMKYVVFTTKHHDGFCMFDSKYTDYKTTGDNCPFSTHPKKNIAKEVFEAFRNQGMWAGAYFSKPDWHVESYWDPKYPPRDRNVNYEPEANPERWQEFIDFTHNQMLELVSDYGKIDIMWLDGGWVAKTPKDEITSWYDRQLQNNDNGYLKHRIVNQDIKIDELVVKLREQQPGLIVVDRAVHGKNQNYLTPENRVPHKALPYPWESCIISGGGWAHTPNAKYMSGREGVQMLVDIVAKGGNLLLNIAPTPEGEWQQGAYNLLEEYAAWMAVNKEAIYSSKVLAPYKENNICMTQQDNGNAYFMYMAEAGENSMPATITVTSQQPVDGSEVHLLGYHKPLKWKKVADGFSVSIPKALRQKPPCKYVWTLKVSKLK